MSPLCKEQLDRLKENFDGNVLVFHDWGDKIVVIVDPKDRGPFRESSDREDAWKRLDEPAFLLIDPMRSGVPRLVN